MDSNASVNPVKTAVQKIGASVILLAIILFLPAGTFNFHAAWIFLGLYILIISGGLLFLKHLDPEILTKRMQAHEKDSSQKRVVLSGSIVVIVYFLTPGFDYRYHWSDMPFLLAVPGAVFVIIGYVLFLITMRQNRFASRVVEIQEGQRVIDTGLYSVIRHPMYLANLIIFYSIPLVLGSYYMYISMAAYTVIIYFRIVNEEKKLCKELPGYAEYLKKVKTRILPGLW